MDTPKKIRTAQKTARQSAFDFYIHMGDFFQPAFSANSSEQNLFSFRDKSMTMLSYERHPGW
jgi:hypothetical protein